MSMNGTADIFRGFMVGESQHHLFARMFNMVYQKKIVAPDKSSAF